MKKILLPALCLALGGLALTGCSGGGEPFVPKEYTADGAQVAEIRMEVRDREIEVSLSADEQIHIQYSENSKEYYDISVSDEKVLTVAGARDKAWTDYVGVKPAAADRKISLQIPDAYLENLTLSTTNADITLPDLAVTGSICLSANHGNITFGDLEVGNALTLTVKNGDISGTIAGSYDDYSIQTEIKKGESNLPSSKDGGTKTLRVDSNHGDVHIEFVNKPHA